jgi:hypothetical protein
MLREISRRAAATLLILAAGAIVSDYAVFLWRQHQGAATGSVTVRSFLATPLKNGRDELDYLGETNEPCVRSLLPHQQMTPCWWLQRHKDQWVKS